MQNVQIFRKKDVDMKLRKRPETEPRRKRPETRREKPETETRRERDRRPSREERGRRRNPRRTEVSSYTILPTEKNELKIETKDEKKTALLGSLPDISKPKAMCPTFCRNNQP